VLARWLSRASNGAAKHQFSRPDTNTSSSTDTIRVRCDHPQVPTDKSNLAYQAAELMATQFSNAFAQYGGVEITIHKRIPVAAGLAGLQMRRQFWWLDLLWKLG